MAIRREIGWSQEAILLYEILKQLERLAGVVAGLSNEVAQLPVTFSATNVAVNPPSLAAGAQFVSAGTTVTGASLGDLVTVSFSLDLQGIQLTGYVSAPNTVTYVFRNGTAGVIDLGAGLVNILVTHL